LRPFQFLEKAWHLPGLFVFDGAASRPSSVSA
jgi:hypothetical protein